MAKRPKKPSENPEWTAADFRKARPAAALPALRKVAKAKKARKK